MGAAPDLPGQSVISLYFRYGSHEHLDVRLEGIWSLNKLALLCF